MEVKKPPGRGRKAKAKEETPEPKAEPEEVPEVPVVSHPDDEVINQNIITMFCLCCCGFCQRTTRRNNE